MEAAVIYANYRDEQQGKLWGAIIASVVGAVILLLFWLVQIVTPVPPIPPDKDPIVVEIALDNGIGGTPLPSGGNSMGNTGQAGVQNPGSQNNDVHTDVHPSPGSITDANSDNASASNSHTQVPNDVQAAIDAWNKNKGTASVKVGGQGTDPYSTGTGGTTGPDVGPGSHTNGTPGTGTGGHGRYIVFKPDIVNPTQEEGKVVIIIHVDRDGNVIPGETTVGTSSTTSNEILRATATQSSYRIKLNPDPDAPEDQAIPIEINFTLTGKK